jgi:hypothetical protein
VLTINSFLSFKKMSYAAVTAMLPPPSRTPTPVNNAADRPGSSDSGRKTSSRQRDFSASVLLDESDSDDSDWNVNKTRRGKSRARGLAKKRGTGKAAAV